MHDDHFGVNPPLYPSITFAVPEAHVPADYFSAGVPEGSYLYGRFGHPNESLLRQLLSRMEGGEDALVFGSGIAATFTLFFGLLSPRDHIVVSSRLYGGTRGQLAMLASKLQLDVTVVDITNQHHVALALRPETKLMFVETISNPDMVVANIAMLSQACHAPERHIDVLLCVDNTFATLIASPLKDGADVVMYSMTKYLSGRSDMMGGALVGRQSLMRELAHPGTGAASLVGGILHHALAHELAERHVQLKDRVMESSRRAEKLAMLFSGHGLDVRYPTSMHHRREKVQMSRLGPCLGGGVFSVQFATEDEGAAFVNSVRSFVVHDPVLGPTPLAYAAVSLGSTHNYVWCTTEARVAGSVKQWDPLPFAPVGLGFVRIAVGYAGHAKTQIGGFTQVLRKLGYKHS